jgi:hypothetical protein
MKNVIFNHIFSQNIAYKFEPFLDAMRKNAENNIKEAKLMSLTQIMINLILGKDIARIRALLPAIERRFFDLRSSIDNINDICSFMSYFGYANCQNDNIWNYLIRIMVKNINCMNSENLADCISGLAHSQRGSNQLWTYLMSNFKAQIEDANIDSKILVLKSLVFVSVEDDYMFSKVLKEELTRDYLESNVSKIFPEFRN